MPRARTPAVRWKSRIVGHGTEAPDQLLANPKNFRRHPNVQRDALRGSLDELGVIQTVLVNKTTGNLVDGHARVEEYISAGQAEVPVTYVELSEEEEALALALLDPISALAVSDHRALAELLAEIDTENEGLAPLLEDLARQAQTFQPDLNPLIRGHEVTAEDLARAAAGMQSEGDAREQSHVQCPHCGGHFYVDA